MEEHGKIIAVRPIRQGTSMQTGEIWQSQDFVIEVDGRYTRKVRLNLFGADRISRANLKEGMIVDVSFEIEAHEYKGEWYNELRVWNIQIGGKSIIRD